MKSNTCLRSVAAENICDDGTDSLTWIGSDAEVVCDDVIDSFTLTASDAELVCDGLLTVCDGNTDTSSFDGLLFESFFGISFFFLGLYLPRKIKY